jgi:DNA transformation protein
MAVQAQYLAYVLEQLAGLPALRSNRMFGGAGLYSDDMFFGLIDDDTLYFKTGPANIEQYTARKMPKFMPFPDKTGSVMGYHQVPADIIEDAESLVSWARQSVAVQLSAKADKPGKRAKQPAKKQPKKKATTQPGRNRSAAASKARRKPARKK